MPFKPEDNPPNGMAGALKEFAEVTDSCLPLSGVDVINILIHHGCTTLEDSKEAIKKFAPGYWEAQSGEGKQPETSNGFGPEDDQIPF